MKNFNKYIYKSSIALLFLGITSCHNFLKEEVYTEYDPNALLQTQEGVDALLAGAYARSRIIEYSARNYTYLMNEFPTDIAFETGGGLERDATPFINFIWDPTNSISSTIWTKMYQAIASANSVLNVTDGLTSIPEENLKKSQAEARFIRAISYYFLLNSYGPTPIIEIPKNATPNEIEEIGKSTPRPSRQVFVDYLIADLKFAAENLPIVESPIGRATKGTALAALTKLYMMEKDWDNALTSAQQVIDLNYYSLYNDYKKMFSVDGEANMEYIYRAPCIAQVGYANLYMPHAFPPNYPIQTNWTNFGAQFRTYSAFYDTFEEGDSRKECFVTNYINQSGVRIELLRDENGVALDNVRSFKYWPDPNAVGDYHGNDIVYIRYADILMCKAEALNEKQGPNSESISLINQIRRRANASEALLTDFSSKDELRDFILAERGREFFSEGLRREDLIRHGKFISNAVERGKNAKPFHVVYPIPQAQLEANVNLVQNEGY